MSVRVAVLDDYQRVALELGDWSALEGRAEVIAFSDHLEDEEALLARLREFDVVVLNRERTAFGARLIDRLPRLRLIVTTGMGNAAIDLEAARAAGVLVCGTILPERPTAELAWALIMAVMRGIVEDDRSVRSGAWQTGIGRELAGSTLGVVGLGRIGHQIAAWGQVFGMRVLAWSPNLDIRRAEELGVEAVTRPALFARSDVVSIHLRLAESTRGLIGAPELELLGPRGRIVNTSRGPIIDESALVRALRFGALGGAALDVFDREPLPQQHPLRSAPRTILTPHVGFVAERAYAAAFTDASTAVAAFLDGVPVRVID
jgi:phosphoglycerate dehydrogenase-like enzyme